MKTIIDKFLHQAGAYFGGDGVNYDQFDPRKFAALVRADERDRATRENAYVLAEREECAKVCEDVHAGKYDAPEFWREGVAYTCAAAIHARSKL